MVTFNQIPPLQHAKPIFFDVQLGDLIFTENREERFHDLTTYREGSTLFVEFPGMKFTKEFPDHDEEVDVFLHACWELIDEVLPRLSKK